MNNIYAISIQEKDFEVQLSNDGTAIMADPGRGLLVTNRSREAVICAVCNNPDKKTKSKLLQIV